MTGPQYTFERDQLVFAKRKIALRFWLQGRGYYKALEAMEFAERYHVGTRKDGMTPEFDHQVSIAHFVRTLPDLLYPEATITTVILHDTPEDYAVAIKKIETLFGTQVAEATELMNKFDAYGRPKDHASMIEAMGWNAIASVAKPADRIHNWNSMIGVFTPEKQLTYVVEGEQLLPMVKIARRRFPQQERAYENIKHMMQSQTRMIRASLKNFPELSGQLGEPVATANPLEE